MNACVRDFLLQWRRQGPPVIIAPIFYDLRIWKCDVMTNVKVSKIRYGFDQIMFENK